MKYKSPSELPRLDRKQQDTPKDIRVPKASPDPSKASSEANVKTTFGTPTKQS